MVKWKIGDECYFIESNIHIKQATIKAVQSDFCVLRYDGNKGIRLRSTKLFKSILEASEVIPSYIWHKRSNPYDYPH